MKSLQLVQRLNARRIKDATDTYLQTLQAAPFEASEARTKSILTGLLESPGPHVYLGETPSGLKRHVDDRSRMLTALHSIDGGLTKSQRPS